MISIMGKLFVIVCSWILSKALPPSPTTLIVINSPKDKHVSYFTFVVGIEKNNNNFELKNLLETEKKKNLNLITDFDSKICYQPLLFSQLLNEKFFSMSVHVTI